MRHLFMIVFLSALPFVSSAADIRPRQSLSLAEWEAKTFEKQPPDRVMDAAGIRPGMVIGEVGAGSGRFTLFLARRVGPDGRVFANDINAEGLKVLMERCRESGLLNVETILGKEDDPLFLEASLDMAFMVWTYHFFDKPVAMLKSLIPALKPGATVVMVEPDPVRGPGGEGHGVSIERMKREAGEAGFVLVRTETFLPEDNLFILRRK